MTTGHSWAHWVITGFQKRVVPGLGTVESETNMGQDPILKAHAGRWGELCRAA